MKIPEIIRARLANQRLSSSEESRPEDVVAWLGAMQSQERTIARWSVAQRTRSGEAGPVDAALAAGDIIRTHVLRPTWHYLARRDFRWILELSAPRVHRFSGPYYKRKEVDAETVAKSRVVMEKALASGVSLTRPELERRLKQSGVVADGLRLGLILMHAELDLVICGGPPRGKHHTYALVDERVPAAASLPRDEALAELATRYFQSHGPATVRDFVWWSSLTVGDARRAVQAARGLAKIDVEGVDYWAREDLVSASASESAASPRASGPRVHLLQAYDEYLVAYRESRYVLAGPRAEPRAKTPLTFLHAVIHDGRGVGSWRPVERARALSVEVRLGSPKTAVLDRALDAAVARYGSFSGKDAKWTEVS